MTFATLPQDLVNICASYISPPELRYMAHYQAPAGADARVTEIFQLFQASYASPATWDLQAGIDPHKETLAGTGRQEIEKYYRVLNEPLSDYMGKKVSESEDPFLAHAHFQGLLIRKFFIGHGIADTWERCLTYPESHINFWWPIGQPRFAFLDLSLLETAFSPVLALEENGSVEVLSEAFYGPLRPVDNSTAAAKPARVDITARSYRNCVQSHSLAIFNRWLFAGNEQLYIEYGGFQDLSTLKSHLEKLLQLASSAPLSSNSGGTKVVLPGPFSCVRGDMASRLETFQRHFRNALSTRETAVLRQSPHMVDNAAIKKFLFEALRKLLHTPPNPAVSLIAQLVKEEIVQRKLLAENDLHKKYLLYCEPFDLEIACEIMTDFLNHLNHLKNNTTLKQGSAGVAAGALATSIDEDETTKGYLALLQRLFNEVIIPIPVGDHISLVLFTFFVSTATDLMKQAPSCEATCVFFTLLYQEARRRKLIISNDGPINAQALLAMSAGMQNAKLTQLLQELAEKEIAQGAKPPETPKKG